jgi:hypothetical protein
MRGSKWRLRWRIGVAGFRGFRIGWIAGADSRPRNKRGTGNGICPWGMRLQIAFLFPKSSKRHSVVPLLALQQTKYGVRTMRGVSFDQSSYLPTGGLFRATVASERKISPPPLLFCELGGLPCGPGTRDAYGWDWRVRARAFACQAWTRFCRGGQGSVREALGFAAAEYSEFLAALSVASRGKSRFHAYGWMSDAVSSGAIVILCRDR